MIDYVEVDGPDGLVRIKPEWMIALGAPLDWFRPGDDLTEDQKVRVRAVYLHGGAQIMVLDTPENLRRLLQRVWPDAAAWAKRESER